MTITLIERKDNDKSFINNCRPNSLLSVDIKVASKAVANRRRTVMQNLISVDQTAYVQGRFIGESVRVINDLNKHIAIQGRRGRYPVFNTC